jgi:ATP-dependent exoDNAse (exonuclease V) beta subunit
MEKLLFSGCADSVGDEEQAEHRERDARKLYMAMTRAGQRLVLVSSQRLSEEIEALFDLPASNA